MLTLDKAIEITHNLLLEPRCRWKPDNYNAIKLVIEASKQLQDIRTRFPTLMPTLLPGETPIIDNSRSLHHIKQILESNEVSK
jgi:hypothetical protein